MSEPFFLSCDISLQVKIKIEVLLDDRPKQLHQQSLEQMDAEMADDEYSEARRLSGLLHGPSSRHKEYYVTCQIYADNGVALSLPARTKHASFAKEVRWHEWLTLPIAYRDLPVDAVAAITVWDVAGPRKVCAVGGTTVSLFSSHRQSRELRKGSEKLQLWAGCEADGRWSSTTPCEIRSPNDMDRLDRLEKRYDSGAIAHLEWLDDLAFKRIEQIRDASEMTDDRIFLMVEFPKFELPVLFFQKAYSSEAGEPERAADAAERADAQARAWRAANSGVADGTVPLLMAVDMVERGRNPVQEKHRVMSSVGQANKLIERELKPSREETEEIMALLQLSPMTPVEDPKELIWTYRYHLADTLCAALPKFCRVVQWDKPEEEREASELLEHGAAWAEAPPAVGLELLSGYFTHKVPREFALRCLGRAKDDELEMYLPQLVQALKYETSFLNFESSDLEEFLLRRSDAVNIGNFVAWNLRLERGAFKYAEQYRKAYDRFEVHMRGSSDEATRQTWSELAKSFELMETFEKAFKEVRAPGGKAAQIKEHVRKEFSAPHGSYAGLSSFDSVVLPVDPRIRIDGLVAQDMQVFKSAMLPVGIHFTTPTAAETDTKLPIIVNEGGASPCTVQVIWKTGDDLRQDSLVVQMFELMDRLLKAESMDLKLTPYRIMPTSYEDTGNGLVEWVVGAKDVADVFKEFKGDKASGGPITEYLRTHNRCTENPDPCGPTFGVEKNCYDTFVKSMAGYTIMTYLLAIGDRHLNNLMIRTTGHLFHIDFGFILGLDPKPLPPPMRVTTEMVTALGGNDGEHYARFKTYCCEAFNILRKHNALIINMHVLMKDAHIPDFEKAGERGIMTVAERFRMDMSDEEAVQYIQQLIMDSVTALMPKLMEGIHAIATNAR